jgi:hypothetical protein
MYAPTVVGVVKREKRARFCAAAHATRSAAAVRKERFGAHLTTPFCARPGN